MAGILGVAHLDKFYDRCLAQRRGEFAGKTEREWQCDNVVLSGLGLPIEMTFQYLFHKQPTFAEFEKWIIEKNDGWLDPLRIERINSAIAGTPYSEELQKFLTGLDEADDVLSSADLEFWNEHGYVIVREAVSRDQAKAAEDAVWEFLGMSPADTNSWYEKPIGKGIMMELYHHPVLTKNRASRRIHKAFAQLWKTSDLWVTTDRTSFNPPENSRYTFQGAPMHWDMSLAEPHHFGTQGLLYLCDTAADQGAFRCVPGFNNSLKTWLAALPEGQNPREVHLDHIAAPIAANAGDLVIWHQALPHGSSPNRGNYPRIVQYLNMFPTGREENLNWL